MSQMFFYQCYFTALAICTVCGLMFIQLDSEAGQLWTIILQGCSIGVIWKLARETVFKRKLFIIAITTIIVLVLVAAFELTILLNVPKVLGLVCAFVVALILTSKLISTALNMGNN